MKKIINKIMLLLPVFFLPGHLQLMAQVEEAMEGIEVEQPGLYDKLMMTGQGEILLALGAMLIVMIILLIIVAIFMFQTVNVLSPVKPMKPGEERLSFYERFKQKWVTGRLKPVDQQSDMLLDHNYDGIQEMDYKMPPWLSYIFIGTFLFAIFYVPAYLFWDLIPNQQTEYQEEIQEAALMAERRAMAGLSAITAETAEFQTDEEVIKAGQAIYQKSCAVCHAADGGGGVGPNLADEFWIHDSDIKGVFTTISEGVPAKGMIPWKGQLSPKDIQDVANFVISLAGTSPAQPKEPQGEPIKREKAEERIEEAVDENLPDKFEQ